MERANTKKCIIVGGGAQAKYVIDILKCYKKKVVAILEVENNPSYHGTKIGSTEVVGYYKDYIEDFDPNKYFVVICHSDNKFKEKIYKELKKLGYTFPPIIHPTAYVSKMAVIQEGCIINSNVSIMPFANIGRFVVIHSNSVIEHDCEIQDFANIGPSVAIAGYVKIGRRAYVYTNATIFPKINIGADAIVGAGAVVTKDVPERAVVYGVPARLVRLREKS